MVIHHFYVRKLILVLFIFVARWFFSFFYFRYVFYWFNVFPSLFQKTVSIFRFTDSPILFNHFQTLTFSLQCKTILRSIIYLHLKFFMQKKYCVSKKNDGTNMWQVEMRVKWIIWRKPCQLVLTDHEIVSIYFL